MEHEQPAPKPKLRQQLFSLLISAGALVLVYGVINLVLVGGQKAAHHGDEQRFNSLKAQIEVERSSLDSQSKQIDTEEAQVKELSDRMKQYEATGQYATYDANVDPYNALYDKYMADINDFNAKLPAFNAKVDEANKIAKEIGSTYYVVPIPTGRH